MFINQPYSDIRQNHLTVREFIRVMVFFPSTAIYPLIVICVFAFSIFMMTSIYKEVIGIAPNLFNLQTSLKVDYSDYKSMEEDKQKKIQFRIVERQSEIVPADGEVIILNRVNVVPIAILLNTAMLTVFLIMSLWTSIALSYCCMDLIKWSQPSKFENKELYKLLPLFSQKTIECLKEIQDNPKDKKNMFFKDGNITKAVILQIFFWQLIRYCSDKKNMWTIKYYELIGRINNQHKEILSEKSE